MNEPLWGKHRGVVVNNLDPHGLGRVQIFVPSVMREGESRWAMPCVPYSSAPLSLRELPPAGTHVWVEFEGGDAARPIWSGVFWAA